MTLDRVPAASRVFIDSTIFIYHATGVSSQCRTFLERCEAGDVRGLTSVVVLAEVAHRLMMIEAVSSKMVTAGNVAKKLRAKPELVRRLHIYQEQIERIPLMGVDVAPVDLGVLVRSAEVRREHGLFVNDSLVVAAARAASADGIASADADFKRVKDLTLFSPADLD